MVNKNFIKWVNDNWYSCIILKKKIVWEGVYDFYHFYWTPNGIGYKKYLEWFKSKKCVCGKNCDFDKVVVNNIILCMEDDLDDDPKNSFYRGSDWKYPWRDNLFDELRL